MDKKTKAVITSELLFYLGIDPEEAVKYLESKMASDITPVHVKAHQILKQQVVPSP